MNRDHRKLRVFEMADGLVVDVYRSTRSFPMEERFGLQSQIRRATVSVPTNIVEGCARKSMKDYLHFMNIAMASASEVRYLLQLSQRLGFLADTDAAGLERRFEELVRSLHDLISALDAPPSVAKRSPRSLKPEARSPMSEARSPVSNAERSCPPQQ